MLYLYKRLSRLIFGTQIPHGASAGLGCRQNVQAIDIAE